uniref:Uncharacterized protein n=1 Tax=Sphaerodactylus townsendi TaxID=933632 RepID=A0ACB8EBW3_9SAUR
MALRFRSLLPFAIPGVLALIGWWWFSSRKKEHTSNHDRRDLASLEECRIGSHKRRPDSAENWAPSSKDDRQADCKLAPPSEMERPAEAWLLPDVSHPVKAASPEQRAQSFGCSADLPVPSGTTAESETLQDDSKKLDITVVSQDALGRPAQEPPLLSQMTNDSHGVDVTAGGKPESSPSGKQVPRVGDLVELPPLEESLGDNLEKKRTGGVSLDEEEVEKIEQVAIHIISQVILAATEEVLSSSVSDMTDRLCQMAAGHIDKPLEKVASGAVCPAESNKGSHCASEKAAVGCAALLEENAHHHATFSSRLTHGLLANPSHSWPRDSTRVGQAAGEPAPFANHKEELEDVPVVAEFSGCSSCTSEDGGRAEDLLRNGSSPVSRQQQDLSDESAVKDSEHSSAPLKNPLSPALPETQVPYSNGVLREDCLDLQHEQPWPAEADADHSGEEEDKMAWDDYGRAPWCAAEAWREEQEELHWLVKRLSQGMELLWVEAHVQCYGESYSDDIEQIHEIGALLEGEAWYEGRAPELLAFPRFMSVRGPFLGGEGKAEAAEPPTWHALSGGLHVRVSLVD